MSVKCAICKKNITKRKELFVDFKTPKEELFGPAFKSIFPNVAAHYSCRLNAYEKYLQEYEGPYKKANVPGKYLRPIRYQINRSRFLSYFNNAAGSFNFYVLYLIISLLLFTISVLAAILGNINWPFMLITGLIFIYFLIVKIRTAIKFESKI